MAGPPDMAPSELWLALTEMPRPHRVVDFPRADPKTGEPVGQIAIRVLTQEEQMTCSMAADREAKRIMKERPAREELSKGYDDLYNNAAATEILFRACRRPGKLDLPVFPPPSEMRRVLSSDEIGVLMRAYFQVQAELGPIQAGLTDEECEAWISRLEAAADVYPLGLLSLADLDRLLMYSVRQLSSSRTGRSSAGSQPNDTSERSTSSESESE